MPFLTVLLTSFTVYFVSLDFPFLIGSDDTAYIFQNPYLQSLSLETFTAIFSNLHYGDYLPVTLLSYAWDFTLWGFDPFGYHLTQMILHSLNACLLFVILDLLEVPRKAAWVSVLLFSVHPVQVESVVWVSERKNLLSSLFIFTSLWFYLRYAMSFRFRRVTYYLSLLSFILALLSKSIAVMLPCIFVLLDFLVLKRKVMVMEKIPFFLLSFLAVIATIYSQSTLGAIKEYSGGSFPIAMLYTLRVFWDYGISLIFPFQLSPMYFYNWISLTDPQCILAYLLFLVTCYYVAVNFRTHPCLVFAIGWFFLWLLPVSNLIPISVLRHDRYMYLPSIAVIVPFVMWLERWGDGQRKKQIANSLMLGWVFFMGCLTFAYMFVYANDSNFRQRMADQNPKNAPEQLEAGYQCQLIKDTICAEKYYRRALAIRPDYSHALSNLGWLLTEDKKYEEAQVLLDKAIRVDPKLAAAYRNRIVLAEKSGIGKEKIPEWMKNYERFKQKTKGKDYLLGGFRFR